MRQKANYSYIGIAFIILVFGIWFVPKIVDRINSGDIIRNESRTDQVRDKVKYNEPSSLVYIENNGTKRKVPEFSFVNQKGDTITNKDYEGKVYVIEFFFTTCPTICPRMNSNLVQIQNELNGYEDFGIASFTINPDHDTPQVLKSYADLYKITNPNWHLLTGDKTAIYKLANEGFYIYAAENKDVEGGFEHSGNFALIDKNGYIRSRTDEFGNPIIYYKGIVSESEAVDDSGEEEQISMLKTDIVKLLEE